CADAAELRRIPIGRPIANARLYALGDELVPTPIGIPSELHIGGVAVGLGYWRAPHRTAERFLPDPFGESGSPLHRTGDLARWLPDGTLDYLGRTDHQVKLRGFRIELGEIEGVLGQPSSLQGVAVAAIGDTHGGWRLVAYVVVARSVTEGELARFAA